MKAAVLLMVVVAAAVAVPIQWLELEPAKTLHKSSRLGDVYSFCSKLRRKLLRCVRVVSFVLTVLHSADKSLDPLVITSLSLVPDPPKEGQPVTLSLTYDLSKRSRTHDIIAQLLSALSLSLSLSCR